MGSADFLAGAGAGFGGSKKHYYNIFK